MLACFLTIIVTLAMSERLSLDPNSVPHILEATLAFTDRQTLLAARLVSLSMRDVADRLLSGDTLDIWSDAADSSAALTATSLPKVRQPQNRRVPCFHPNGSVKAQRSAVIHASCLKIHCFLATPRLNDLLQHARQTCDIVLSFGRDHARVFTTDVCIPPCSSLKIHIPTSCFCLTARDEDRYLKVDSSEDSISSASDAAPTPTAALHHEATTVRLHLERVLRGFGSRSTTSVYCPVAEGAVNAGVRHLHVSGDVRTLPKLFDGVNKHTHHDLHILFSSDRALSATKVDQLLRDTARCFSIPRQQMHYEVKLPERQGI